MPRDHRIWWAFTVSVGLLCPGALSGCLRSTDVRGSAGPASAPAASAQPTAGDSSASPAPAAATAAAPYVGQPQVYPSPSTSVAALPTPPIITPRQDPSQSASIKYASAPAPPDVSVVAPAANERPNTAAEMPAVLATVTPGTGTAVDPVVGTRGPSSSSATPLLDAAAVRVSAEQSVGTNDPAAAPATPLLDSVTDRIDAVTRQHQESLFLPDPVADPPRPNPSPPVTAVVQPGVSPARVNPPDARVPVPGELQTGSHVSEQASPQPATAPAPSQLVISRSDDPPLPPGPIGSRREQPGPPPSDGKRDSAVSNPVTGSASDQPPEEHPQLDGPLAMSQPQLCRRVHGFGSYEPLGDPAVKAGQRLLIYSDVTGLKQEETDDAFISRISSRLELRSQDSGSIRWQTALEPKQDSCRRPRHDFYVNYVVELPATLEPGAYRLRVTLTDLIAGRDTSTEIQLEVAR
jgi:hypothetical protein